MIASSLIGLPFQALIGDRIISICSVSNLWWPQAKALYIAIRAQRVNSVVAGVLYIVPPGREPIFLLSSQYHIVLIWLFIRLRLPASINSVYFLWWPPSGTYMFGYKWNSFFLSVCTIDVYVCTFLGNEISINLTSLVSESCVWKLYRFPSKKVGLQHQSGIRHNNGCVSGWWYHQILLVASYRSQKSRLFVSITTMEPMLCEYLVHYGLKVVFDCMHARLSLSKSSLCRIIWKHWAH